MRYQATRRKNQIFFFKKRQPRQLSDFVRNDLCFFSLICNCLHKRCNFFRIPKKIVFNKVHLIIKLKYIGYSSWKVELKNFFLRKVFEDFDYSSEAIPMCSNEDFSFLFEGWEDSLLQIRKCTSNTILERFSKWKIRWIDKRIARIQQW